MSEYHIFAEKTVNTEIGQIKKDSLVEVQPVLDSFSLVTIRMNEQEAEIPYRDIMNLDAMNPFESVIGTAVDTHGMDKAGFPLVEFALSDEAAPFPLIETIPRINGVN